MNSSAPSTPEQDAQGTFGKVSLLGHDLRAAMSDVIGGLRLIDENLLDEKTRTQLARVRAASEALARLIEQELMPLQGEDGFDEPLHGNVQVPRMLHDLQNRWAGRAQEKGLGFRLIVAPEVPKVVSLDRVALERVASNLLSNAVKFTETGEVRLMADLADANTLRIRVEDDGPGFSETALANLFVGGARADGRGKPGLGLGLMITKEMLTRLRGSIDVANGPTGGAVVTVLVHCNPWQPPDDPGEGMRALPDLSRFRVLVADDSPTNQAVIGNMLAAMGAEFELASDGVEAMNWLDRERFDLLLLDIEMPRMSGLEVLREVRALHSPLAQMLVLAISAYVLRANREAIYQAGADGILVKPVMDIHSFGHTIRRILSRSAHQDAGGGESAKDTSDAGSSGLKAMNSDRFENLMRISGRFGAVELLRRLLQDLQQVERGVISNLADENLAQLRAHTHVLISVAGAVGAEELQAKAQRLNDLAHQGQTADLRRTGDGLLQDLDRLIHLIAQELSSRMQSPQ